MLIVNGTITAKTWAQPIPCNVKANRVNNLGKHNGNTFIIASYEVLIESRPFDAGRVRLTENGRDLGEFSVMWTEYLDAVGFVKIVV